jgi:hypothetical protein
MTVAMRLFAMITIKPMSIVSPLVLTGMFTPPKLMLGFSQLSFSNRDAKRCFLLGPDGLAECRIILRL